MLVCLGLIISRLESQSKFQMFTLYSSRHIGVPCMDVHQHGIFLLGSVNFWETFVSYLVIFYSVHHNFLAFAIGWFSIYYFLFIA